MVICDRSLLLRTENLRRLVSHGIYHMLELLKLPVRNEVQQEASERRRPDFEKEISCQEQEAEMHEIWTGNVRDKELHLRQTYCGKRHTHML